MDREEAIKVLQSKLHLDCSVNMAIKELEAREVAISALREQEQSKWISDRLPTEEECNRAIVGVVNGYNGRITFTDAEIFVCYDFKEKDWYSEDYDIEGCAVRCWYVLPEPPKEGADRTCETCYANDMEHDAVDNPCWNCKGNHSEWSPKEGAEG